MEKHLIDYHKKCEMENVKDILLLQDESMDKDEFIYVGNMLVDGRLKLYLTKYGEDSWEYQVYKEMVDTKYVEQLADMYCNN